MPTINYDHPQPFPASYPSSILGRRFSYQGKVYLADPMGMRWIENPTVYNALFRDSNGITTLTDSLGNKATSEAIISSLRSGTADYQLFMRAPQGPKISEGAALMKDPAAPEVYLVESGMKRHIASPVIMDQYYLNWKAIQLVETAMLAALKTGPVLDATLHVDLLKSTPMYVTFEPGTPDRINSAM